MNEIRFPDPFRPSIEIILSGSVQQNVDGTWEAYFSEINPGYGRAHPSTTHSTRKKAEKWVRKQVRQRLLEAEETRQRLSVPAQKVDLTGIQ